MKKKYIWLIDSLPDQTPLHRAVAFGNEDVIVYLLEQGADIEAKDSEGNK